jgi:hypothetical protein
MQVVRSPGTGWSQRISNEEEVSKSMTARSVVSIPRGRNQLQSNKSIKTTGSARKMRSRSRDNNFQIQHNNMMSRQQFKTKTTRSLTSRQSDAGSIVSFSSRKHGSINASASYESGYLSQFSRSTSHSGFDGVPKLIENPTTSMRDSEKISSKVRNIIEGEMCKFVWKFYLFNQVISNHFFSTFAFRAEQVDSTRTKNCGHN